MKSESPRRGQNTAGAVGQIERDQLTAQSAPFQSVRQGAAALAERGSLTRCAHVIQIRHSITYDSPDGLPWPPADGGALWVIVRRADGCTLWRAIGVR